MAIPISSLDCEPSNPENTLTKRLNDLLRYSGPGYTLSLCPGEQYLLIAPLHFAAPDQEISTAGLPTDSTRATLVVNGTDQTVAVYGTCALCDGVKLRNVQIDGARRGASIMPGGANIEMGGSNANQLIEYVHSFDPRGWSCLHIAQGNLDCTNVTIQNNDIGPAGSSAFEQWADGISLACRNSLVKNNMISNPTDGAIVLFGSPGSRVENNTIWVETEILLGGINLVDVSPFGGDFNGVVIANNTIAGGFASEAAEGSKIKGTNEHNAMIKVGIAIGPSIWFGNRHQINVSGGRVENNRFTGALAYGIAMSSVTGFTVENNVLVGNTSFIGVRGENCTMATMATPAPFVLDPFRVQQSTMQPEFELIADGNHIVTCVAPPTGVAQWPFGKAVNGTGFGWSSDVACKEPSETLAGSPARKIDSSAIMFGLFVVAMIASAVSQVLSSRRRVPRADSCRKHAASCKCSAGDIESTRVCSA